MKRHLIGTVVIVAVALACSGGVAYAQSGHFLVGGANAIVCVDMGTTVVCSGKVAGLGGTTFEIRVEADGIVSVECENPAGHVAPGQDTELTLPGSSGPLPTPRNGQYVFTVATDAPSVPNTPTCPNNKWTASIIDVAFTTADLTLLENGQIVQVVYDVPVSSP